MINKRRIKIENEYDILVALSHARFIMKELSFSPVEEQKILVTVSELTRNVLTHAGVPGSFQCEALDGGLRITVEDKGKGISNLDQIMAEERVAGATGLGLGLLGVKRLMDDVSIESSLGGGTKVIATKWKRS